MPSTAPALPPREQNIFKAVVRLYETKQLKKAVKQADLILKKFPNHGETLAMKGLALNALDRKTEAHELVKKGLVLDMRSHICWHVYGLLYRSDRDYREAAKAYLNALRIDKDNQQILRDLALLQVQIRDFEGLEETRRNLLTVRPNQKNNWIGFALSFHLLGNYATAISVLDTYQDTLKGAPEPEDPYEVSELLLYKNLLLEESENYEAALSHLEQNESRIVDLLAFRETQARLLSVLRRHEEAAAIIRSLLAMNPDNVAYHRGLQATEILKSRSSDKQEPNCCSTEDQSKVVPPGKMDFRKRLSVPVDVSDERDVTIALKICDEMSSAYPRSRTSARTALDVIPSGDHAQFLPRVDAYVRPFLKRGIPSLFSDMKPLYSNASKSAAIGKLFENYRVSLEGPSASLPEPLPFEFTVNQGQDNAQVSDTTDTAAEQIDTEQKLDTNGLLWVRHYLAQHYDRVGKRIRALELIDQAIEFSPKTIECYLVKARILKHCGDTLTAVKVANEARCLDLADRYLNTKCTKYGLRADMVSQAEAWISLFTRDGDSGGPQALYDMQCMWFELEAAESHLRRGHLSPALKKFTAVDRHFADMVEDQFDFHSYCLRKVTLRAYVSLLRFEDRIRSHPYFERAASGAIKCLLLLADLPKNAQSAFVGDHSGIEGFAQMSEAERKKAISKQKKRDAKKRQKQNKQSNQGAGAGGPTKSGKATAQADGKANGSAGSAANGMSSSKGSSAHSSGNGNSSEKPKSNRGWMENDPQGSELVKDLLKPDAVQGPLERALGYVREMERHLGHKIETHQLAFEIAIRRRRYLQALRAVKRAQAVNNDHPMAISIAIRLVHELENKKGRSTLSTTALAVFDREGDVLGGKSPLEYLEAYRERQIGNACETVGAAEISLSLAQIKFPGTGTVDSACSALIDAINATDVEGCGGNVLSAAQCKALIHRLQAASFGSNIVARVVDACQKKHVKATCFVNRDKENLVG